MEEKTLRKLNLNRWCCGRFCETLGHLIINNITLCIIESRQYTKKNDDKVAENQFSMIINTTFLIHLPSSLSSSTSLDFYA